MKKTLLTMSFLALTYHVGFAGNNPFEKAKTQSKVNDMVQKQQMKMMPFLGQLENHRTTSFTPDSVTIYEYDSLSWRLTNTAKVRYTGSGDYSLITIYLPPPLSIPVVRINFVYNQTGKLTLLEQTQLFPAPSTFFKLEQSFDANQNLVSRKVYEINNGTLTLMEGDSVIYDYSGTTINGITTSYYDGFMGMWMNASRAQGMQYNVNGEPTALDIQEWDDQLALWSSEILRYTALQWGFGFSGILEAFGIEDIDVNDFLNVLPDASFEGMNAPTDYLGLLVLGSTVDTMERSTATMSGASVAQVLYEEHNSGSWELSSRTSYAYNANNLMLSSVEEFYNGSAWENSYRETWEYSNQGYITKEMGEFFSAGSWMVSYGSEYVYQNTIANIPFEIIKRAYNLNSSSFEPYERMVFNFGSSPTSVADYSLKSIVAYPNPVVNQLTIRTDLAKTELLTIDVLNITGQLVFSDRVMAGGGISQQTVSFASFDPGVYFVRVGTSDNTQVIRIIK